jgi:hypothetical protein
MFNKPRFFTIFILGLGTVLIANYRVVFIIEPNIPPAWEITMEEFDAESAENDSKIELPSGYLQGKVCNIDGKPIKKMPLYLYSLDGGYRSNLYLGRIDPPQKSNDKGNYRFEIPAYLLPNVFNVTKWNEEEYTDTDFPPSAINLHQKIDINLSETVNMDIMIDELPRTRPWWHFKYNTGKCDAPWPF